MYGITGLPEALQNGSASLHCDLDEREHVWFIINRAYQSIYGLNLPHEPTYQKTIFDAAFALKRSSRTQSMTEREFIQLCEDVIRISDEHARLAQQHHSRASNPVYLRETALDNALEKAKYATNAPTSAVVGRAQKTARLNDPAPTPSSQVMELAYQQLAMSVTKVDQ